MGMILWPFSALVSSVALVKSTKEVTRMTIIARTSVQLDRNAKQFIQTYFFVDLIHGLGVNQRIVDWTRPSRASTLFSRMYFIGSMIHASLFLSDNHTLHHPYFLQVSSTARLSQHNYTVQPVIYCVCMPHINCCIVLLIRKDTCTRACTPKRLHSSSISTDSSYLFICTKFTPNTGQRDRWATLASLRQTGVRLACRGHRNETQKRTKQP